MAKKYTSNYNIKEDASKVIAPKYFNKESVNGFNLGTIGFITDLYANATEDMFNSLPTLMNELFPNTCQFPTTIYNHAAMFGNDNILAKPASLTTVILINERDVLQNASPKTNGFSEYIIDENTYIRVEDINFKIDYPIKILVKPYKGDYIFTASYVKKYNNKLSDILNPFIKMQRINYNHTKYLALLVKVRQVYYNEEYFNIIDNNLLNVPFIEFNYSNQLCNFEVFYRDSNTTEYIQLVKKLNNSKAIKTPFCYYEVKSNNTVEISFSSKENTFKPSFNSEILVKIWTTDGEDGNFDMYTGSNVNVYVDTESIYEYNAHVPLIAILQTPSTGGQSCPTLDELKEINTDCFSTVTSYTTEADLERYFNNFNYIYNQRVHFIKKRDDIVDRLYSSFAILKDEDDYYYKTNTLNAKIYPDQYDIEYQQSGRHILKPGHVFIYDGDSRKSTLLLDETIYDDLDIETDYMYTNPFLMTVSKGGVVGYYMNSRNDKIPLEYSYVNDSSLIQFICNFIYVYRNAMEGEDKYKLKFIMTATDEDIDSPLINEDGTDAGRVKMLVTLKDRSGNEIAYTFAHLVEYNTNNRMYTFEAELKTDDYINTYEKIRISGIKEIGTGRDKTTMISMINLDVGVYAFFKYEDQLFDHKFSNMEELKDYSLTNAYETTETKITLAEPLDILKSNMKYIKIDSSSYYTMVRDIPLVQVNEFKNNIDRYMYFMKILTLQYAYMREILLHKTNNYSIDMKFYNTCGRSRNFTVDGTEELLNSVNCKIHFKVSLMNPYTTSETIKFMKIFIKDYFEEVNDNGLNGIYISNLIQALENEFEDIKYIKFISMNGYDTFVQCIENERVDLTKLTKQERIEYVPEFLNIELEDITIELI